MSESTMSDSRLNRRFFELCSSDRVAIVDDDEQVSFAELGRRVRAVAQGLADAGLAGKRVALLVSQGSAWIEAFFGIIAAGGVAVPSSHLHPEAEQEWFVETSGAEGLLVCEEFAEKVEAYRGARPRLVVEQLRGVDGSGHVIAPAKDDDVAVILYTSGTTGKPKGALISHGNLGSLAEMLGRSWQWTPEDCLLHCLPLHHLHGLGIALFVSLLAGASTRMIRKFDAGRVWEEMAQSTVLMGVPTMHKLLLDALDGAPPEQRERWVANAGHLRLVTSGSAALPSTVGERWKKLTGDYPLERFGMTEIGVGMTNPIAGVRKPGYCGAPLEGMEIRIVGEDGADVVPGQSGEIWVKGRSVFLGYDKNPKATEEAFSAGWFKSGDTATWDDEGYCKILGRTSVDIFKSGGYKLSALEIEELFREHEAVADVAVVGVPDETWGEIAVACVIPRSGMDAFVDDEAGLRDWAKQHVASYKVPRRVLNFVEFPRNPVGKVVKPRLLEVVLKRLGSGVVSRAKEGSC